MTEKAYEKRRFKIQKQLANSMTKAVYGVSLEDMWKYIDELEAGIDRLEECIENMHKLNGADDIVRQIIINLADDGKTSDFIAKDTDLPLEVVHVIVKTTLAPREFKKCPNL